MRFPLWLKLGLLFGTLAGGSIAAVGWVEFTEQLDGEIEARRTRLVGLATTLGFEIEGDIHQTFTSEAHARTPEHRHLSKWMRVAIRSSQVDWIGSSTRDADGHWSYVVDSADEAPFPVGYPIFDGIADRDRAWETGEVVFVAGLEDEFGRWDTAFAPITSRGGAVVGMLEVVLDADQRAYEVEQRTRRIAWQMLLGVLLSFVVSGLFSRWLNRHLHTLTDAALDVADGNLERQVHIPTQDEIGLLGSAFDRMVAGLRERELIRDTFGRFVNHDVAEAVLADPDGLALGGSTRTVTILMSDLRGFTALSNQLGPERMVELLNRYFTAMSEVVLAHDGNIAELVGDGMVVFFGAPNQHQDDPRRAIRCAIGLQQALQSFNAAEGRVLEMGIGIDTGTVIAGNIGSEQRMKYGVVGDAINLAARLESFTIGNQVLVTEATLEAAGGYGIDLDDPIDVVAKGRPDPIRCYPVLAMDGERVPVLDEAAPRDVQWQGQIWRIVGKKVEVAPHDVSVVHTLGRTWRVQTQLELDARDKVKLAVVVEGQRVEDIYATVVKRVEGGVQLRLTSVPEGAGPKLDA